MPQKILIESLDDFRSLNGKPLLVSDPIEISVVERSTTSGSIGIASAVGHRTWEISLRPD